MKAIVKRKGVKVHEYMLQYIDGNHKLFSICDEFQKEKFAVKAVNKNKSSETVVAVCGTRKIAEEVIVMELVGEIV